MNGRLIVFEGVEGCGKTTQLQRLQEWLPSICCCGVLAGGASPTQPLDAASSVVVTREPGGTKLGLGLRKLLLDVEGASLQDSAELLLYAADRAQHVEEVLKPNLTLGAIVLCDRYTDSTIAYQGYGRGLSLSLINQLNQIATGGLESDLTIWLDIDVEVGLARLQKRSVTDRIEQANLAFHRRVQQGYTELAKANPNRIVRVNGSLSEAAVQEQIQAIVSQWLIKH